LQDGVAYTAFFNGLLLGRFKFSFVENKVTTLANALRRAQYFIRVIEMCNRDDFFGKILGKVWERTMTPSQTSAQGRTRRGLDDLTLDTRVSSRKSKEIQC